MENAETHEGWDILKLGNDIQELILAANNPGDRFVTGQGGIKTMVSYDIDHVLSALCWATANFIVQSGAFPTRHDRKRAVKLIEGRISSFCPQVERFLDQLGTPKPSKPN